MFLTSDSRLMMCPECREEQIFERPECLDGHHDCADLACTACGMGVTLGTEQVIDERVSGSTRPSRVA
jgi:hypothetical protein